MTAHDPSSGPWPRPWLLSARGSAIQVVALLAFHSVVLAQTGDAVWERSRLLSDPELAAKYVLDVIRQGIQSGHVERTFGVLHPLYYDEEPAKGSRVGRGEVMARLRQAIGRAQGRPRPQGFEYMSGLYDFGWSAIELHLNQAPGGPTEATVHAEGSGAAMSNRVRVTFHLRRSASVWRVVSSTGFTRMASALETASR